MKAVAGVLAAGALAGAVAASAGDINPAPVNPCKGMQTREEVFEFTRKPQVRKEGEKYVITFASKGRCDATVWVESPNGRVVAHLGSGVLGKNTPYPFGQDSLAQRIEWDGKDDTGKPVPAGCRVRVGLGLRASFERVIAWDPHNCGEAKRSQCVTCEDGTTYVMTTGQIRAFDRNGKYLKTIAPHPAGTPKQKLPGLAWLKTTDGDEVPVPPGRGWRKSFHQFIMKKGGDLSADPDGKCVYAAGHAIGADGGFTPSGKTGAKKGSPGQGNVPAPKAAPEATYGDMPRLAVDPARDEVYVNWAKWKRGTHRYDGKTGKLDTSWPDVGTEDFDIGPDGLFYARIGFLGKYVVRLDRSGKPVPFEKSVPVPDGYYERPGVLQKKPLTGLYAGQCGSGGNVHAKGFDVAPNGDIYLPVQYVSPTWRKARFKPDGSVIPKTPAEVAGLMPACLKDRMGSKAKCWPEIGGGSAVAVFGPDGGEKTLNALPGCPTHAHGLRADRWGNVYTLAGWGGLPSGQKLPDGLAPASGPDAKRVLPAGTLVKFRGGPFPLGRFVQKGEGIQIGRTVVQNALWAYGGLSPAGGSACSCTHARFDVDPHGRAFVPAVHLYSVVVLDGNGNRVLRIGRYGNADSQGPGSPVPEPEIAFAWIRATAASDTALYVYDPGNCRILKAKLGYHAQEEAPLP